MRRSGIFASVIGIQAVLAVIFVLFSAYQAKQSLPRLDRNGALVKQLELTDLCLFTEARYTRHLSQADLFAPFQDHPQSFEHFPSGSLVAPPDHIHQPLRGPVVVPSAPARVQP